MTSHGHRMAPHSAPRHAAHGGYGTPMAQPAAAPPGTFAPGTKIQIGSHRVLIQKYLSEGGFAHVYLVKLPKPIDGTDLAVLKRVAVPDKDSLRGMRTEVETMKRLKGHRPIVTYMDSHASELQGGGYEVFLLMEYCDGGGLIDFMNTRLQHRLTEPEIISIFTDIAEGLACMHYLKPALLHRDIKVENVLITNRDNVRRFKLCDFGSASAPKPAPTTVVECRLMDEDVQKHTTLQYRSPEMVDVYRKQPMNEKSDIWALGVLLYKLCYYTTPFEDQGQLAILNASFKYPSHPVFSDRLKILIGSMLKESMQARPNIYQVLKEACAMQGRKVPIPDIYSERGQPGAGSGESLHSGEKKTPAATVGAVFSAPTQEKQQSIPDVVPMRRGRPTASPSAGKSSQPPAQLPSAKITQGDPFAALDSKTLRPAEVDELSSRFPSLNQFSLLHNQGSFDFNPSSPPLVSQGDKDLNQKLTERLAEEAFVTPPAVSANPSPSPRPQSNTPAVSPALNESGSRRSLSPSKLAISRAQSIIRSHPELHAIANQAASSKYVSTGTMTDFSPKVKSRDLEKQGQAIAAIERSQEEMESRGGVNQRVPSFQHQSSHGRHSGSPKAPQGNNRLPMEPPNLITQSNLSNHRQRPASSTFEPDTLEFLRERENASIASSRLVPSLSQRAEVTAQDDSSDGSDDEDFLRGTGSSKRYREMRGTEAKAEVVSSAGPKNMLIGKFGDAFKRFEKNKPEESDDGQEAAFARRDKVSSGSLRIESAGAPDGSDGAIISEDEDCLSPEMRREMERRKLAAEEARVEAAQAEYRKRVAEATPGSKPTPGPKRVGGAARAASIQNRVQSLLSEEQKPSAVQRTAQGYGKYTDTAAAPSEAERPTPEIRRKPVTIARPGQATSGPSSGSPALPPKPPGKPSAPKKPVHLNSLPTGGRPVSPIKSARSSSQRLEQLVAVDLPGRQRLEMTAQERDDYIEDFTKRFPSVSAIEMDPPGSHVGGGSRR